MTKSFFSKKKIMTVLLLCITAASYAQSGNDLAAKAQQFANEVFADAVQYTQPEYIDMYKKILSRIEITVEAPFSGESYPKLSGLPLIDKYNQQLQNDWQSFNPEQFNPMKYLFNLNAGEDVKYRVDNTNYVIVIHPAQ